jgi:type IV pilus assembly protein PilW
MLSNKVMIMSLINRKQSQGFSLIELMVAMVVGLIIVSGAFSLHSGSRKTQIKNEEQMDMVADARFAIDLIAYDLRHAGMWGGTNKDGLIACKSTDAPCVKTATGDTPPSSIAGDCATGWYYNLSQPVFATNNSNPYGSTCITSSEGYVAGTDVLEIRYADSNVPTAMLADQVYVRSNFINGRVFVGGTAPELDAYEASPLTANHELHAYAYYISNYSDDPNDGIPSLRRVALVNLPSLDNQLLVSGVVDLQVLFGVDANDDQLVDRYDPPDVITAANNWVNVYSAKIWLVMRTDKVQLGINTNEGGKKISIAGNEVSLGGQDDFRYFTVSTVVDMRNLKQI